METPYAALKAALKAQRRAMVKLNDARHLATDRNATVADLRTMLAWLDQFEQAELELQVVLRRLRRLKAPPAGEQKEG